MQAAHEKTITARQRVIVPESLVAAVSNRDKVTGAPHDFYRYPARFSPLFAREAIKTFTEPGDFVLDPFCGGGTTLVEALSLGRRAAGMDVSSLAAFLARTKTTPISVHDKREIAAWLAALEKGKRLLISGKLKLIWFRKKREGYDRLIANDKGRALFKRLQENKLLGKEFQLHIPDEPSWYVSLSKHIDASDIQFAQHDGINPGPFCGSLDYFDLDTDIQLPKNVFNSASDYRDQVKNLAQMYVYRDGFGIRMPNDWLRLGAAWTSEAGYYSLKPSNVIGFFRISVADTHCAELVGSNPTWQLQFLLHGQRFKLGLLLSMILRKSNPPFRILANNRSRLPNPVSVRSEPHVASPDAEPAATFLHPVHPAHQSSAKEMARTLLLLRPQPRAGCRSAFSALEFASELLRSLRLCG